MAEPWNTYHTFNLIYQRRYYVYDEGPRRTAVYLVEEYILMTLEYFLFKHFELLWI